MKRCTKCGLEKPQGEFYGDRYTEDGFKANCKECSRESSRDWQRRNKTKAAERTRKWRKDPANAQREKEMTKRWQERNKAKMIEANKRYKERNPEKIRAHNLLTKAIQRGEIVKPEHCEDCGKRCQSRELDGHHEDYSKPLVVIWLCRLCHARRHKAERDDQRSAAPST